MSNCSWNHTSAPRLKCKCNVHEINMKVNILFWGTNHVAMWCRGALAVGQASRMTDQRTVQIVLLFIGRASCEQPGKPRPGLCMDLTRLFIARVSTLRASDHGIGCGAQRAVRGCLSGDSPACATQHFFDARRRRVAHRRKGRCPVLVRSGDQDAMPGASMARFKPWGSLARASAPARRTGLPRRST